MKVRYRDHGSGFRIQGSRFRGWGLRFEAYRARLDGWWYKSMQIFLFGGTRSWPPHVSRWGGGGGAGSRTSPVRVAAGGVLSDDTGDVQLSSKEERGQAAPRPSQCNPSQRLALGRGRATL